MEGIIKIEKLISWAKSAGLEISLDGFELVIEGPEECAALAIQIIERKPEAVRLLCDPPPTGPGRCLDCDVFWDDLIASYCYKCGELRKFLACKLSCGCVGVRRWRYKDGGGFWHCETHDPAKKVNVVWSQKGAWPAPVLDAQRFEAERLSL